jgi:hypothetical protein
MNVHEQLNKIQKELKAPRNQFNKFGGYKYRNCEDILEAVKPLLGECILVIEDDIVKVDGRVYIKAKATLEDPERKMIYAVAFAREPESRKGMDESQITGAASSYARKYALNGLFCIDDTKDADTPQKPETKQEGPKNDPLVDYKMLVAGKGMTVEDTTDFENWCCNVKKEADFKKLIPDVVANFDKAYSKWIGDKI